MKKINIIILGIIMQICITQAQNDTMYVMKAGVVINKQSVKVADVDSIIFYKPPLGGLWKNKKEEAKTNL